MEPVVYSLISIEYDEDWRNFVIPTIDIILALKYKGCCSSIVIIEQVMLKMAELKEEDFVILQFFATNYAIRSIFLCNE